MTTHPTQKQAEPSPAQITWSTAQPWISLVVRVGLSVVFFWSGIAKVTDLAQSEIAVRGFQILPDAITPFVGAALPIGELIVGVLLLVGLLTRYAAICFGLLMLAFVVGIINAWAHGISIDCGCFGGGGATGALELSTAQRWTYTWEIARDVGLALVAGFLVIFPWSHFSADRALAIEPKRKAAAV